MIELQVYFHNDLRADCVIAYVKLFINNDGYYIEQRFPEEIFFELTEGEAIKKIANSLCKQITESKAGEQLQKLYLQNKIRALSSRPEEKGKLERDCGEIWDSLQYVSEPPRPYENSPFRSLATYGTAGSYAVDASSYDGRPGPDTG